ncbi:glycerophosphoryl diester phosphodiesterase membrane domain-containing protein [Enterococcus hirae]|uniref:glycerophosphoryl diester phosphodiesterase membrane domain-containing protein n=1 Tax=Enterococcus hirae TaxID=1354 RepID=UPI0009BD51E7|nr:glycerophosphodiester phosphodiesterase [Enterococcus hirae]HCE19506.1 glycerophosphodiester phosphodiesterase [Enterococcus sp.]EMF0076155.1 glycerophosphodiester phosphodiesterase [Enterococcus hirae]MBA5266517.1 glycerophosphoryl diester phosphodiesterase membrane domain-containing protein [Enterococcus hirae]MEB7439230.1 glycerophosphodiester phosphodiesterase [Enterococcus hirae]OQO45078.1 glycerophosphodiester phosphodiesterase [Enterococcus hirae]
MLIYLKRSLGNAWDFLKGTQAYFRDVLIMHLFILFICLPLLNSTTRFILNRGAIDYISSDNISTILSQHPGVLLSLTAVLLTILLLVYFEFTFLLMSVYFIKKQTPISLKQLLQATFRQLKKIRPLTFLFFLAYFVLILPISGLSFNSDLLSKVKIPAFIMDFIFTNRWIVVSSFILFYIFLAYIGIRLIFALPEMILRDRPFKQAVKESWYLTKSRFFAILGQFIIIGGSILLISFAGYLIVLLAQIIVEQFFPNYSLISAVFAMTILQAILLFNIVMSTVGIFYIIIDFMDDEGFLPETPNWFRLESPNKRFSVLKNTSLVLFAVFFGVGVCLYNMDYLTSASQTKPVTISHRGVSGGNSAQNTLAALEKTSRTYHPDYVEMDVQETKDGQFVVMHDFNLKKLTGINKAPQDLTLKELEKLKVTENGAKEPVVSFDTYLKRANELNQRLLIEIKNSKNDSKDIVERFVKKYEENILTHQHILQSLTYQTVSDLKNANPNFYVGYILPFNIVGPPVTPADFLTMEYSTINRNFIDSAHQDGKKVYVWTVNDSDGISRMMFYGVDGIITDQMTILNENIKAMDEEITYSDKLLNFVLGVG